MNNPYPPEFQRRLRALHLYVQALEVGDLESLSRLLHLAEEDAVLDRMFQEIDLYYQVQEQLLVQPDEMAALEQRLAQLSISVIEYEQAHQNDPQALPHQQSLPQERRQTIMYHPVHSSLLEQETQNLPPIDPTPKKTYRQRARRPWQILVAALLAITLLSGFLLFYMRQNPRSTVTSTSSQTVGVSKVTQDVLVGGATQETTTYTIYALRARSNTPIWSKTLLSTKDFAAPEIPLLTQNQTIYTVVDNIAFAVNAQNGQLLWEKNLPFFYGSSVIQINGDILIAGGLDKNRVGSIYRIDEQTGALLWHYQAAVFALGNGVVYAGLENESRPDAPHPVHQHFLRALNGTDGKLLWSQNAVDTSSIRLLNNTIYVESAIYHNTGPDSYVLSAWTASGSQRWSVILPAPISGNSGWPDTLIGSGLLDLFGSDGLLVFETDNYELCTYRAENGQKAWCTSPNPDVSYTYFQVQNSVLYTVYVVSPIITGSKHINPYYIQALNLQTGVVIWSHQAGSPENTAQKGSPTAKNTAPYFTSEQAFLLTSDTLWITSDANIFAFSLSRGEPLWQTSINIQGSMKNVSMLGFINLTIS